MLEQFWANKAAGRGTLVVLQSRRKRTGTRLVTPREGFLLTKLSFNCSSTLVTVI